MSWYNFKAGVPFAERVVPTTPWPHMAMPEGGYYPASGRQVSLTFTVTNMHTPEDADRLVKSLKGLNGVVAAIANLKERKLTVTYFTPPVSTERLAYTIGALGYHYLERA